MTSEELKQLTVRVGALAQELERQSLASTQRLAQTAQALDASMRRARDELTATIRTEARTATAQGTAEAADAFSRTMKDAMHAARHTAEELRIESGRLRQGRRFWVATALTALAVGSLLTAGGSSYVVWKNRQSIERIEYQLELQRLAGPEVRVEVVHRNTALETSFDGRAAVAIREALATAEPDVPIVPFFQSLGTDAKYFSTLGMQCFGFVPLRLDSGVEYARMFHGVDERVPLQALRDPLLHGELATVASPAALARIVARAIAEERTTLEELEALCERLHDVPGVTAFRELLPASRLVVVRSRSRRESQFVRLVVAAGLPRPMVNLQVADVSGQTRFLDAAWLDYGVFAEIDVHPVHGITIGRRLDGLRQNDLVPAWIPLRFDENDLDHRPDEVVATVRRALIARGWTPDDEDGATDGPSTHIA
jgi:ketosteroid isomerase-like protein